MPTKERLAKIKQDPAKLSKLRERQRQYELRHKDQINLYRRKHRALLRSKGIGTSEKEKEWNRNSGTKWRSNPKNRGKLRFFKVQRRGREYSAPGNYTLDKWYSRVELYGWKCAYCAISLNMNTLTQDHVIPLVRGGSNWPANLVPACQNCNVKKNKNKWLPKLSIKLNNGGLDSTLRIS